MDCIVIGAGVVGLAVARALAQAGREVIILERERQFGMHTSSRNSEVIHAGIHYEPGSLKARLCVAGRDLLYRYCAERGIGHRRCGKLTVATAAEQLATLEKIDSNARANGVLDLEWLDAAQAGRVEPQLRCLGALWSPSTGIIDSHAYMQSLLADAEASGATVAYGTQVASLRPTPAGIEIAIEGESGAIVRARAAVNCAGLQAHEVAASIEGFPAQHIPVVRYAKGSYFALSGASPFTRLVYPAPRAGGHLGIHLTIDLAGTARFGPDTEWVEVIDYAVDTTRVELFAEAIRQYWPGLDASRLQPAYAGIRPKISGEGEATRDFCISDPQFHGVRGIVNLFGIESPGLTASLALGETIAAMIE
ncbi:MAG TPA: NAD(P)/FAD-dependent oxidoreductase [Steroidobacteraceae bacterium]|nr:NAD(P)/FAD-dependent oxidoreductase [Steroidobacteraceae bacterium]